MGREKGAREERASDSQQQPTSHWVRLETLKRKQQHHHHPTTATTTKKNKNKIAYLVHVDLPLVDDAVCGHGAPGGEQHQVPRHQKGGIHDRDFAVALHVRKGLERGLSMTVFKYKKEEEEEKV